MVLLIHLSEILYGLDLGILLSPIYGDSWQPGELMDGVEVQIPLLLQQLLLEFCRLLLAMAEGCRGGGGRLPRLALPLLVRRQGAIFRTQPLSTDRFPLAVTVVVVMLDTAWSFFVSSFKH